MREQLQELQEMQSVPNHRKYLELLQGIKAKYHQRSQRLMVLNTELARQVYDGELSYEHRTVILEFFESLEG